MVASQQQGTPISHLFLNHNRYYGLAPDIKVIAPWREWDLLSRTKLIEYAEANSIPVPAAKRGEPPFSMDANLLHISYEGCGPAPSFCPRDHLTQLGHKGAVCVLYVCLGPCVPEAKVF